MFQSVEVAAEIVRTAVTEIAARRHEIVRHVLPLYMIGSVIEASLTWATYGVLAKPIVPKEPLSISLFHLGPSGIMAAYLAVLWHRMILKNHSIWPSREHIFGYITKLFLQALAVAPIMLVLFVVITLSIPTEMAKRSPEILFEIGIVGSIVIKWIFGRIGLVLPAAAVGDKSVGFRESWSATSGISWTVLWIVLVLHIVGGTSGALVRVVQFNNETAAAALYYVLRPIQFVLVLTVLCVLYQVRIVEPRRDDVLHGDPDLRGRDASSDAL